MAELAETRLDLRRTRGDRDRWKQSALARARVLQQVSDDCDKAWREVERLRAELGMDCCEGGAK